MGLKVTLEWNDTAYYTRTVELDDNQVAEMKAAAVDTADPEDIFQYLTENTEILDGAVPVDWSGSNYDLGEIIEG